MRRAITLLAATAAVAAGLIATSPAASAHAVLQSSEPAAGASLAAAPERLVLRFSEPPDLVLSSFRLLDASGAALRAGRAISGGGGVVEVPLPRLGTGAYTMSWRVVSTVDGHLTAGAFAFGIGVAAPATVLGAPTAGSSPPPSVPSVAGRTLLAAGVALLYGAAVARLAILRRPLASWRWSLPAAWLTAWVGLGVLVASEAARADAGVGAFLGSGRGWAIVRVGLALAVAAAPLAVVALRRPQGRGWFAALLVASGAVMLAQAAGGHAGAERDAAWLQVGLQWMHLLAIGAWVGGLVWLLEAMRATREPEPVVRFAKLAAPAIVVVLATGLLRSRVETGSLDAITGTSFGTAVLLKLGLFAIVAALGARNHFRLVPRIAVGAPATALRKAIRAEVLVAVALFSVAGVLTELPPPVSVANADRAGRAEALVVNGADFATTVRVRLTLTPGAPGVNAVRADVVDYDSRRPLTDVRSVSLRASLPDSDVPPVTIATTRAGGAWTARTSALALEGRWRIVVLATRADGAVEVPLVVPILQPAMPAEIASIPGQPTLYTVRLAGGASAQTYADPGTPGPNQVHVTFFTAAGGEMNLARATMTITTRGGAPVAAGVKRLTSGHFVADATLPAGEYRVVVSATTSTGEPVALRVSLTIGRENG